MTKAEWFARKPNGKWLAVAITHNWSVPMWQCNQCSAISSEKRPICPNCKAKMEADGDK